MQGYSKISSYEVVKNAFDEMVKNEKLSPGDRLPSEPALAKRFGVSRTVLRETYRMMERDGFIVVRGGAGTFLTSPSPMIANPLNDLNSTGAIIKRAGFEAGAEVLQLEHREPKAEWADRLKLESGERVVVAKRVRKADDMVIALSWNIMPERLVSDKLDRGIHESIFRHLENECGIVIASAHTGISALCLERSYDKEAKKALGDSAILMKRLHFNYEAIPVLYSLDFMRTDLVELTIHQERKDY